MWKLVVVELAATTCFVLGGPMMNNPCTDHSSSQAQLPWCNPKLPIDERVKDMISRMTTQEKIQQLDTSAPAIPSLGLNAYNWWSEGTHGISHVKNDDKTPYESNFAFPITTAMSFNRTLWQKTGGQIGREARAFMNAGNAYSTYWAPVVNLAREPRWGRNIETPGEDPYLSGEYATAFVKGFERSPDDPTHIQASACCKHYAANSMEHSTVAGETWTRHNFDANISMQDLVDSYLLPFQACVEKGQVSSLMCSYNAINGVPSCANDWLLTDVARNSWGFDGYITSDCDADSDVFAEHHYTKTPEETVQKVLHAGTDVDCTSFVGQHAQRALDQGLITIADIDERLKYLFRVRMRLSHFDPEGPLNQIPTTEVCSDYAQALARDGVTQSAALLKNTGGTLPLNAAMLKSVAVIGPNSNLSKSVAGYYGGNSCNNKFYNMVDAVQQHVPATVTTLGVPSVSSDDIRGIHSAVAMAKSVDAVVLVIGTDLTLAHEEMDATGISLSKAQLRLVSEVADASSKPVVVVTLTALPVDISAILSNPKVGAVLHLGQPSVQTLGAGDVLFGLRSPAGKTIQTIYPASYADQVSIFDFNMRPGPSVWPRPDCAKGTKTSDCPRGTNPGRTHRFYTGKAVVPFGYGLSYTTFKYEVVKAPTRFSLRKLQQHLDDANSKGAWPNLVDLEALSDQAGYEVKVTNLGSIDADDVVLGFMKPPGAGTNGIPLQTLFGFTRVHVKAGQSETVWLYPSAMSFMHVELDGRKVALPGEYEVQFGLKETLVHGMGYASARLSAHMEDASADIQSFFT